MPVVGAHHLVSCHQTVAGATSGVTTLPSDDTGVTVSKMDQWGDLTSLSWLHNVKILPNVVDHQDPLDTSKETNTPPESTLKQLLKEEYKGNITLNNNITEVEPSPTGTKSASTAVKINFSSSPRPQIVAKKSKAVCDSSDDKPSDQLTTKDCQQLLFRILNDKRSVLTKREQGDEDEELDESETSDLEEDVGKEDHDDKGGDSVKRRRKEEANLFRSLSEEAKKQILTKKIQIQAKTSVKSLCLHFSSLTKVVRFINEAFLKSN